MRPQSDVQEVDIEEVKGEDMEACEEALVSRLILQLYVKCFWELRWIVGVIQFSPLFIPCEENSFN
jgi:hypothetical protein